MTTIDYKFNIEGGLNFYDELNKMLDEEDEYDANSDNFCLITGQPLDIFCVKMNCGHNFNYEPLFKEIIIQKFIFKTYFSGLSNNEVKLLNGSKIFIKCPYCRSVQKNILPYYEELGLSNIYGVNTMDSQTYVNSLGIMCLTINRYGKQFSIGKKCDFIIDSDSKIHCSCLYVCNLEGTNKNYCSTHYNTSYKKYIKEQNAKKKTEEKQKLLEEKKKVNEAKLEAKNAERIAKGLKPLYTTKVETNGELNVELCIAILTSGLRKGHQCGNKKIDEKYCGRHNHKVKSKQPINDNNTNETNINNINM
jgi:hypothetical protein